MSTQKGMCIKKHTKLECFKNTKRIVLYRYKFIIESLYLQKRGIDVNLKHHIHKKREYKTHSNINVNQNIKYCNVLFNKDDDNMVLYIACRVILV